MVMTDCRKAEAMHQMKWRSSCTWNAMRRLLAAVTVTMAASSSLHCWRRPRICSHEPAATPRASTAMSRTGTFEAPRHAAISERSHTLASQPRNQARKWPQCFGSEPGHAKAALMKAASQARPRTAINWMRSLPASPRPMRPQTSPWRTACRSKARWPVGYRCLKARAISSVACSERLDAAKNQGRRGHRFGSRKRDARHIVTSIVWKTTAK
mmetsp:Transcript_62682/g.167414  ORF Transcript_62682/g.167414 Transcript_62682/m.167414 type:complete len:212 (-) Transcript_62682:102-737(-)